MQNISGNASLSGVTASNCTGSGCHGVWLNNVDGPKGVSLKTVEADGNDINNISISDVAGNANLNNINASDSVAGEGLYIGTISGDKGVSLKTVTALSNYETHIYIYNVNAGGVVISGVTANGSDNNNGIHIENVAGTVMMMKSFFNGNFNYGISSSNNSGLFALKGVEGNNNINEDGAYLVSDNNLLVCSSQFIGNGLSGGEAYGIEGNAPGFSLTIAGTDLIGPPANLTDTANTVGGTVLHENESSAGKVIPVP
jgi:hypothetical protein